MCLASKCESFRCRILWLVLLAIFTKQENNKIDFLDYKIHNKLEKAELKSSIWTNVFWIRTSWMEKHDFDPKRQIRWAEQWEDSQPNTNPGWWWYLRLVRVVVFHDHKIFRYQYFLTESLWPNKREIWLMKFGVFELYFFFYIKKYWYLVSEITVPMRIMVSQK